MRKRSLPEPELFLTGCQPWPPRRWPRLGPIEWPGECPVCGSRIVDPSRSCCGWCHDMAPRREDLLAAERSLAVAVDYAREREQKTRLKLARAGKTTLTETERRRVWNGYRHSVLTEAVGDRVNNLARAGREWLTAIGQAPDWSLVIEPRVRKHA